MNMLDETAFEQEIKRIRKRYKIDVCHPIGMSSCCQAISDILRHFEKYARKNMVDAVPVVRCKDCKHRDPEDYRCDCGCWHMPYITKDEDFCSYGEKK